LSAFARAIIPYIPPFRKHISRGPGRAKRRKNAPVAAPPENISRRSGIKNKGFPPSARSFCFYVLRRFKNIGAGGRPPWGTKKKKVSKMDARVAKKLIYG